MHETCDVDSLFLTFWENLNQVARSGGWEMKLLRLHTYRGKFWEFFGWDFEFDAVGQTFLSSKRIKIVRNLIQIIDKES